MGDTTHQGVSCVECGRPYGDGEAPPCPACGAMGRQQSLHIASRIDTTDSLTGVVTRPGYPRGWLVRFMERTKRSALGRRARESLRIDRSDPTKTVKTHHVEERGDDGTWQVVHDERVEYPSKRRPPD